MGYQATHRPAPNRAFLRARVGLRELHSAAVITLDDLRAKSICPWKLKWLARERDICAANAGLYIVKGRITDPLARLGRLHTMMTVGLTTALWLHHIIDERPTVDHWMIKHARWRPIWLPKNVQVHLSRHAMDDAMTLKLDGIDVRVADVSRALLDCIRFREVLGNEVVLSALDVLRRRVPYQLVELRERARRERVHKPLTRLLGALGASRVAAST